MSERSNNPNPLDKLADWASARKWTVEASRDRLPHRLDGDPDPVTVFHFDKANAWDGWKIFEKLRARVLNTDLEGNVGNDGNAFAGYVMSAIASLNPEFVLTLAQDMFDYVKYSNWTTEAPLPVKGAEASAFEGLEPVVVYEVVGRALAVNFTESLSGLLSKASEPTEA